MPVIVLAIIAAGGAFAYYRSRNQTGEVPTELPGVAYKWRVAGGWSGTFSVWWQRPTGPEVSLGQFDTFDAAKNRALEAILLAQGGIGEGGGLLVGIPASPESQQANVLNQ